MIALKVNGISRQFNGDAEMPLLWVLRDELGLTGSKFGCGAGCRSAINSRRRELGARAAAAKLDALSGRREGLAAVSETLDDMAQLWRAHRGR